MTDVVATLTVKDASGLTATKTAVVTQSGTTGFPDASTTGVRAGVVLAPHVASITSTAAGQIIAARDADFIVVNHDRVTVRDCKVAGSIQLQSTNAVVEYCTVITTKATNGIDINPNGISPQGSATNIRFCNISKAENGIWLEANDCVIEENYIHDLLIDSVAHIDGIQIPGSNIGAQTCRNAIIRHNNIDLDLATATSCVISLDPQNITITNNRFSGGAYTVYVLTSGGHAPATGAVTNNTFFAHSFGYADFTGSQVTQSGNTNGVTGLPITLG